MSDVNPELTDESIPKLRDRVHALFGSRSDSLVRSVARFLQRDPGSLDHQNLRVIAAATRHIDPALAADLIDRLPITRMHVAVQTFDIARDSEKFGKILPRFSMKTRQNLISDLIRENTFEILTFSPPERVTEEGRTAIEEHLLTLTQGTPIQQANAVKSPFATHEVIDAVLDRVERAVERAERGTQSHDPGSLPLELVADGLFAILTKDTATATPEHVALTWSLARRCNTDDERLKLNLLSYASTSRKLTEATAHDILDAIDETSRWLIENKGYPVAVDAWYRSCMISVPEMPESAVFRAVSEGVEPTGFRPDVGLVDQRWYHFRRTSCRDVTSHHTTEGTTSADVDRWIASLPIQDVTREMVDAMTDRDALTTLGRRAPEMAPRVFVGIAHNPNAPRELFVELLSMRTATKKKVFAAVRGRPLQLFEGLAVGSDRLSDSDIARALHELPKRITSSDEFMHRAVSNRSAGVEVFEYLIEQQEVSPALEIFARCCVDPDAHRRIADLIKDASRDVSDQQHEMSSLPNEVTDCLRRALAENCMLSDAIAEELWPDGRAPVPYPYSPMTALAGVPGYGPGDIAHRMVADGRVDRTLLAAILELRELGPSDKRDDLTEAITVLADAGILDERTWRDLTSDVDRHDALQFATHPNCKTHASDLQALAASRLDETVGSIDSGTPVRGQPQKWSDLPDARDRVHPLSPAAALIDGQVVEGLTVTVPRTARELDDAADYMGNCLKSYAKAVRDGTHFVATMQDPARSEMYAVAWHLRGGGKVASISEINSRHNKRRVPPEIASGVRALTESLNQGRLKPVRGVAPPTHDHDAEQGQERRETGQSSEHPLRQDRPHRRVPHRREALRLDSDRNVSDSAAQPEHHRPTPPADVPEIVTPETDAVTIEIESPSDAGTGLSAMDM